MSFSYQPWCIALCLFIATPVQAGLFKVKSYSVNQLLDQSQKIKQALNEDTPVGGMELYDSDPAFQHAVQSALKPVGLSLDDFDMYQVVDEKQFAHQAYTTHFWQKRLRSDTPYDSNELVLFLSYPPKTQQIVMVIYDVDGEAIADEVMLLLGDRDHPELLELILNHPNFDLDVAKLIRNP